ncbi:MAG: hypothetical protein JXR77_12605, partial [Lentisphaeria bacterium]|nr:hypothetical protein [Lentisphaeria bacterium]
CDGGSTRLFGWSHVSPHMGIVATPGPLRLAPSFAGEIALLRLYDRSLLTSEAIANHRHGT